MAHPKRMDTIDRDKIQHLPSGSIFRVAPSELKLGHKVIGLDLDWGKTPWRGPSIVIEDFATKAFLKDNCDWIIIDLESGVNRFRPSAWRLEPLRERLPAMPEKVEALAHSALTSQTLKTGAALYSELHESVRELGLAVQRSGTIDAARARRVVRLLGEGIGESLAALFWLSRIKDPRLYLSQHIINSTILMGGFVHGLGWSTERIETAAMVALFHDLGKFRIDRRLLFKEAALDDEEFNLVRSHPTLAADLMRSNPDVPWEVTAGVAASHERPDGAGYPSGLKGDAIPVMARLIAVVDAYDAMTSRRAHGRLMTHQQALGILWKERGAQFDGSVVERFIQLMGWVTPGTLVRLSDQRLAVVMEVQHDDGFRGIVRPLTKTADGLRMGGELGLRPQGSGNSSDAISIAEMLPDGSASISSRELIEQVFAVLGEHRFQIQGLELSDAPGQAEVVAKEGQGVPASGRDGNVQPAGPSSRPSSRNSLSTLATGLRVLVIDDAATVRVTLQRVLEQAGAEVVAVDSGESGLREVQHALPDLVFLDILLPGISGFSTLRKIRKLAKDTFIPVVMVSGNPQATQQLFIERIGADDFLPKPFADDDVMACLKRLLQQQKLRPAQPARPAS